MRILFLDDDPNRRRLFAAECKSHDLTIVDTPEKAITALRRQSFDLLSLDHDLFGQHYAPSDERSGYAVAKHIAQYPITGRVIVHSYNKTGAGRMVRRVVGAEWLPFGGPEYWRAIETTTPTIQRNAI